MSGATEGGASHYLPVFSLACVREEVDRHCSMPRCAIRHVHPFAREEDEARGSLRGSSLRVPVFVGVHRGNRSLKLLDQVKDAIGTHCMLPEKKGDHREDNE